MSTTTEIIEIEELALIYSSLTSIDIFITSIVSIGIGYHEEVLHHSIQHAITGLLMVRITTVSSITPISPSFTGQFKYIV